MNRIPGWLDKDREVLLVLLVAFAILGAVIMAEWGWQELTAPECDTSCEGFTDALREMAESTPAPALVDRIVQESFRDIRE